MIEKTFFAKFAEQIDSARCEENNANAPFGGLNVTMCGDFHQLPPVACRKMAPLYCNGEGKLLTGGDLKGRMLYEQFENVVLLTDQIRVMDVEWTNLLRNV